MCSLGLKVLASGKAEKAKVFEARRQQKKNNIIILLYFGELQLLQLQVTIYNQLTSSHQSQAEVNQSQ